MYGCLTSSDATFELTNNLVPVLGLPHSDNTLDDVVCTLLEQPSQTYVTLTSKLVFSEWNHTLVHFIQQRSLHLVVKVLKCLLQDAATVWMFGKLLHMTDKGIWNRLGRTSVDDTLYEVSMRSIWS